MRTFARKVFYLSLWIYNEARDCRITFEKKDDFIGRNILISSKISKPMAEEHSVKKANCEKSKMKRFAKIINGSGLLTIFAERSVINVWENSQYASYRYNQVNLKLINSLKFA